MNNEKQQQSQEAIDKNIEFFCDQYDTYNKSIQNLDTYRILYSYINQAVKGIDKMLDIGNGGVFDYDASLVSTITGIDLFFDKLPPNLKFPPNVQLKAGSALDIPEANDSFNGVLMVMLLHHLVGENVASTILNVETAINEAHRVLQPGGKLIIVESCVPNWFYQFEKIVFPLVVKVIGKISNHPATLQYPIATLKQMIAKQFKKVEVTRVPVGKWVNIYGKTVPAILTPVTPVLFIAEK